MISQVPCPDCWDFLARLELVLGLEITVFVGDTPLPGTLNAPLYELFLRMPMISGLGSHSRPYERHF
jgi:hypothetical protein